MPAVKELKKFYAKDRKAWRRWLESYHEKQPGVWLIYYKKGSGKSRVSYDEAVEEALCFGWIDSIVQPIDEEKFMQKFTPRKTKTVWSGLNKKRVEKLIAENLMMPAGMKIIEIGKQNGSWTKLDHVENQEIPADLKKVFAKNKKAAKWFEGLTPFRKKQVLYRLGNAKLAETRARRIAEFIAKSKNQ